ncbi:MAG: hypothetical protein NVV60_10070 [Luteimonas sp.]|nr:hypothetical protein [Luteimonas sp.]
MSAAQGDAAGQYELGNVLLDQARVDDNNQFAEGVRWYRLAAEQGHPDAQRRLAIIYAGGRARNDAEAARLRLAAATNSAGRNAARDDAEALRWYRLAAAQGRDWGATVLGPCPPMGAAGPRTVPSPPPIYGLWPRKAIRTPYTQ